jgi:hypothetical protein
MGLFVYVFVIAKDKKSLANNQANLLLVLGKKLENNSPDGEYISIKKEFPASDSAILALPVIPPKI